MSINFYKYLIKKYVIASHSSLSHLFIFLPKCKTGTCISLTSRALIPAPSLLSVLAISRPVFLFLVEHSVQQRTLEGRRPLSERGLGLLLAKL